MSNGHPCPVCDARAREPLFVTRDRHYRIPGEWRIGRCSGCGLVQLDPMPTTEQLMSLYPTDFYAYSDITVRQRGWRSWVKRWLFPTLLVQEPAFDRPGRVLDSGCGTGWSLLSFRDRGWECVGLEPSEGAARFGRERYGLDVRAGTVHTERFGSATFDYIRSNHSLEHDPQAGETIAEFRRLIRPDGRLLVGVPNIGSLPARWFGRYWWYLGAPVHTYNFSLDHLTRLLARHGFAVESVRYAGNYGGVLGSLQIYLNRDDPSKVSTDGWVVNAAPLKLLGQGVAALLNLMRQGDAIEVTARPVASHGAAGREGTA